MDMDISQYKELFINEAQEHLEALNQSMVDLEKDPGNPDVLTEIFRSAHTLKGMSATMGFDQLTELAHEMENVLDGLRGGDIEVSTDIVDLLFGCFDMLGAMVADIAEESGKRLDTRALTEALRAVYAGEKAGGTGIEARPKPVKKGRTRKKARTAKVNEEPEEKPELETQEEKEEEELESEQGESAADEAETETAEAEMEETGGERNLRLRITLDLSLIHI
jgi:two-component system chemotaxis sensor kinase CheA